jgi:hypothetical protein
VIFYLAVEPRRGRLDVHVLDAAVEDVPVEGGLELGTVVGLDHLDPEGRLLEHVVNAIGLCFVADRTCAFPVSEADGEPIPAVLRAARPVSSIPADPQRPSQTEALPRSDTSSGCN